MWIYNWQIPGRQDTLAPGICRGRYRAAPADDSFLGNTVLCICRAASSPSQPSPFLWISVCRRHSTYQQTRDNIGCYFCVALLEVRWKFWAHVTNSRECHLSWPRAWAEIPSDTEHVIYGYQANWALPAPYSDGGTDRRWVSSVSINLSGMRRLNAVKWIPCLPGHEHLPYINRRPNPALCRWVSLGWKHTHNFQLLCPAPQDSVEDPPR